MHTQENVGRLTLHMRDDCGGTYDTTIEEDYTYDDIEDEVREWVEEGVWGEDGGVVECWYVVTNANGNRVEIGSIEVKIQPDHEALIMRAMKGISRDLCCGYSPDDHDWTREGEGGCTQNPGVWSTGGTGLVITSHCRDCGLRREEHIIGSQHNPGEHDTVAYSMPDSWCVEWQSTECGCEEDTDD